MLAAAQDMAQSALQQALIAGDTDNEFTYRALEDVIRRLGNMPGDRILVLASPGFLLSTQFLDEMGIIDRANKRQYRDQYRGCARTVYAEHLWAMCPTANGYAADGGIQGHVPDAGTDRERVMSWQISRMARAERSFTTRMIWKAGLDSSRECAGSLVRSGFLTAEPEDGRKIPHDQGATITEKRKYNIQARRGLLRPQEGGRPEGTGEDGNAGGGLLAG